MPIYAQPTKTLMHEFVAEHVPPGKVFTREDAVSWFEKHYPKIKPMTVRMHVVGMSINSRQRKHHSNIKPNSGHDLFYKLGPNQFRLWDSTKDEAPYYASSAEGVEDISAEEDVLATQDVDELPEVGAKEFPFENDLRNYIARNLTVIEPGLKLYDDEGIEVSAGGRRIDVLCVDAKGSFVVIELKVSRGYERTIGQLLRYMGWVQKNLSDGKSVRGVIVASNISDDLKIAASLIPQVSLIEYQLSFSLKHVKDI